MFQTACCQRTAGGRTASRTLESPATSSRMLEGGRGSIRAQFSSSFCVYIHSPNDWPWLWITSGLRYSGVPQSVQVRSTLTSSLEKPKSVILM